MKRILVLAIWIWASATARAEKAADWPQWGGPSRNATSPAVGVFGEGSVELRELWRRPGDEGISALIVKAGRIFSLASAEGRHYAFALEADTGEELWRLPLGESELEYGPASTPATDGRRVYLLSPGCKLLALEAASGEQAWQLDFFAAYDIGPMRNGCWTSPILEDGRLVVQVNGAPDKLVVAFDKDSGEEVWSVAGTERAVRSSPSIADLAGRRQVLVYDVTRDALGGVYGLDSRDGAVLWKHRFEDADSFSFDLPIPLNENRLAVLTWNDIRAVEVGREAEGGKTVQLWASRAVNAALQPYNHHALYHDGHIYGFGDVFLVCLDAATGATVWQEKTYGGSLILVDGHLVVLSEAAGLVRVVEATPRGYREKARLEVLNPGALANTPPSFAGRSIYLRNSEEIVALEVAEQGER